MDCSRGFFIICIFSTCSVRESRCKMLAAKEHAAAAQNTPCRAHGLLQIYAILCIHILYRRHLTRVVLLWYCAHILYIYKLLSEGKKRTCRANVRRRSCRRCCCCPLMFSCACLAAGHSRIFIGNLWKPGRRLAVRACRAYACVCACVCERTYMHGPYNNYMDSRLREGETCILCATSLRTVTQPFS